MLVFWNLFKKGAGENHQSVEDVLLYSFFNFFSFCRITSSLLSIMSSATCTWASCEIMGGIRLFFTFFFTSSLGESDRGGEHPGELAKSGWIRL